MIGLTVVCGVVFGAAVVWLDTEHARFLTGDFARGLTFVTALTAATTSSTR